MTNQTTTSTATLVTFRDVQKVAERTGDAHKRFLCVQVLAAVSHVGHWEEVLADCVPDSVYSERARAKVALFTHSLDSWIVALEEAYPVHCTRSWFSEVELAGLDGINPVPATHQRYSEMSDRERTLYEDGHINQPIPADIPAAQKAMRAFRCSKGDVVYHPAEVACYLADKASVAKTAKHAAQLSRKAEEMRLLAVQCGVNPVLVDSYGRERIALRAAGVDMTLPESILAVLAV